MCVAYRAVNWVEVGGSRVRRAEEHLSRGIMRAAVSTDALPFVVDVYRQDGDRALRHPLLRYAVAYAHQAR